MADVFLSYARADRKRAEAVKAALQGAGLSVFFDVEGLDGGDVFPDVLDREVKTAGAVVSLWSPHALSRPWVKQECSIGLKRKCLIPLMIEPLGDLDVPVAFEGLQQIDFTGFHGRTDTPEWRSLMRSLSRTLKRPELVVAFAGAGAPGRLAPEPGKRGANPLWYVSGGLALLLFITVGMLMWVAPVRQAATEGAPGDAVVLPVEAAERGAALAAPGPASDAVEDPGADETGGQDAPSPGWAADQTDQPCSNVTAYIYFDFDKTVPNAASISVLEDVLTRAFNCDIYEVRIEAHDDLVNSPAYAQALSERRGTDVVALLVSRGVDHGIITSISYGSSQPEFNERTPLNRRAVVYFNLGDHPQ